MGTPQYLFNGLVPYVKCLILLFYMNLGDLRASLPPPPIQFIAEDFDKHMHVKFNKIIFINEINKI